MLRHELRVFGWRGHYDLRAAALLHEFRVRRIANVPDMPSFVAGELLCH
jgi:hypothetical protein